MCEGRVAAARLLVSFPALFAYCLLSIPATHASPRAFFITGRARASGRDDVRCCGLRSPARYPPAEDKPIPNTCATSDLTGQCVCQGCHLRIPLNPERDRKSDIFHPFPLKIASLSDGWEKSGGTRRRFGKCISTWMRGNGKA